MPEVVPNVDNIVVGRYRYRCVQTENALFAATEFKGTNPALKKPSNIPEIYAKMFGRFH